MSDTIKLHKRTDYTIDAPAYGQPMSMSEIERLAENMGSHYFESATMRFFSSRIDWHVFTGSDGWYFVTSEQNKGGFSGRTYPRAYSVRRFNYETTSAGDYCGVDFDTVGEFQQYPTLTRARTAARKAAEASWQHKATDEQTPCCYPVAEGSPQGAPCYLVRGHIGKCNAYPAA